MRWEEAMRLALEAARETGQRWHVRGYRKFGIGPWRYGAYRTRGWA